MKRNTLVLGAVLFVLATFAWAGWANFEYRRQAAEKLAATSAQMELVAANSSDSADTPPFSSPLKGRQAPAFSLEDLSGKKVSLANYKGKAVLINFWATWCGPCKVETPWLVELRDQYASKGFEILGMSTDDFDPDEPAKFTQEKQDVAKFAQKMHMQYPILVTGDQLDKAYGGQGGLDVLPVSFFVNRTGKVVAVQFGLTSKDDIEGNIKKALGQ